MIIMPQPLGGAHRVAIERALRRGFSNRETSLTTGAHKNTVIKMRRLLGGNFLCACGKPATHGGWCVPRYKRHPLRRNRYPIRKVFGLKLALIRCREHTYKTEEQARRSFYKFVCKTGRYARLSIRDRRRPIFHTSRQRYAHGHAKFRIEQQTQASWEMTAWRAKFEENWPTIQEAALARTNSERNAELVRLPKNRRFFQLNAAGAIA